MSQDKLNPSQSGSQATDVQDTGISLDRLNAAFAEMLKRGDDPYGSASAAALPASDEIVEELIDDGETDDDPSDRCPITPSSILEAILFVGYADNRPVASKEVAGIMRGVRPAEIDALVRALNRRYAAENRPYQVISSGAGYRMVLRESYGRLRDQFYGKARQARLSQAAIEVLAIVAYHQPIAGDEVAATRGAASGHILSQLVRRGLLELKRSGRAKAQTQYSTSRRFLRLFGLTSLEDLPRSEHMDMGSSGPNV